MANLRHIDLRTLVNEYVDDPDFALIDLLFGLPSLLDNMRMSNVLEKISILVETGTGLEDNMANLKHLDQVLAKPGWHSLHTVDLRITVSIYDESVLERIPDTYLPLLSTNKAVKFGFRHSYWEGASEECSIYSSDSD